MGDENRRKQEQVRRENDAFWRGQEAYLRRDSVESYKKYPEVGDPPPGKIKFAFGMTAFVIVILATIFMCGAVVWAFLRVF